MQFTLLWITCCTSWEVKTDNELRMQADISTVTSVNIYQAATLITCAETCVVQNFAFLSSPNSSSSTSSRVS